MLTNIAPAFLNQLFLVRELHCISQLFPCNQALASHRVLISSVAPRLLRLRGAPLQHMRRQIPQPRPALQEVRGQGWYRVAKRHLQSSLLEYELSGLMWPEASSDFERSIPNAVRVEEGYKAARWPIALAAATVVAGGFAFLAWWRCTDCGIANQPS